MAAARKPQQRGRAAPVLRLIDCERKRQAIKTAGVVRTLEALLEDAREGQIQGLAYMVKMDAGDHVGGCAGHYRTAPTEGAGIALRLANYLAEVHGPIEDE